MHSAVISRLFQFNNTIAVVTRAFLSDVGISEKQTGRSSSAAIYRIGLHCETGIHCNPGTKSLLTNVIEPLTVTDSAPIKSILPPEASIKGPLNAKKVTVSPGPKEL